MDLACHSRVGVITTTTLSPYNAFACAVAAARARSFSACRDSTEGRSISRVTKKEETPTIRTAAMKAVSILRYFFEFASEPVAASTAKPRSFLRRQIAISPAAIAVERAVASKRVVESIPSPITQNTDSRHGD